MAKPILFLDFDKTLCFDRYWRSLPAEQFQMVQEYIFGADRKLLHDWMRGKYTAEEVNILLAEKLGMPYQDLWQLFVRDCETMEVSAEALEMIQNVRKKYMTILVTGNMDSFMRFTVPALKLRGYFDRISSSSDTASFKDDGEGAIFREYAKNYHTELSECVLIDDSPRTCETFRKLGGIAYQATIEEGVMHHLSKLS